MSRIMVKICGLTRSGDVAAAAQAGADALGFVFAGGPRRLSVAKARDLTSQVPDGIMRVGLFMNQEAHEVEATLARVKLDLLQFHGSEANDWCAAFGLPFVKAISMLGDQPGGLARRYPDAMGILLDSHEPGGRGGTGERFDWRERPELEQPIWLAGGLNPDNVTEAIRQLRPVAVDVSSGVESAPGIKDKELIKSFIQAVRAA